MLTKGKRSKQRKKCYNEEKYKVKKRQLKN